MSNPPRLGGDLIVRKGEAAPAVAAENVPPAPARTVERPAASKPARASVPHGLGGTIAVTVRLDPTRYERLKMYGVRQRRTNQELLVVLTGTSFERRIRRQCQQSCHQPPNRFPAAFRQPYRFDRIRTQIR